MATGVDDESINTFMAITTATREHARRSLQACNGDLNAAVNHFMEHEPAQSVALQDEDEDMDTGDEPETDHLVTPGASAAISGSAAPNHRPPLVQHGSNPTATPGSHVMDASHPLFPAPPVRATLPNFPVDMEDEDNFGLRQRPAVEPRVSHPLGIRDIPADWRDEDPLPRHHSAPTVQELPADADEAFFDTAPPPSHTEEADGDPAEYAAFIGNEAPYSGPAFRIRNSIRAVGRVGGMDEAPTGPPTDPSVEEEMMRSAMEASRLEAEEAAEARRAAGLPLEAAAGDGGNGEGMEDDEIARAMALSLQTAEEEREFRETAGLRPSSTNQESDASPPFLRAPHAPPPTVASRSPHHPTPATYREAGEEGMHPTAALNFVEEEEQEEQEEQEEEQEEEEEEEEEGGALVRRRHFRRPVVPVNDLWREGREGRGEGEAIMPRRVHGEAMEERPAGVSSEDAEEARMIEAAMFGIPYVPSERAHRMDAGGMGGMGNDFPYQEYGGEYGGRRTRPHPPSEEVVLDRLLKEQQDDEYMQSLAADREKAMQAGRAEEEQRRQREEAEQVLRQQQDAEQEAGRVREEVLGMKRGRLTAEPGLDADANVVIQVLIRMPDGSRKSRRFRKDDTLQALFDFIDVNGDVEPGSYQLLRQFPKRIYLEDGGEEEKTLRELGLDSKQEMLILQQL